MRITLSAAALVLVAACASDATPDRDSVAADTIAAAARARWKKRLTGADLDTAARWDVGGTDLGIPYVLENGSIGYLFGDTYKTAWWTDGGDVAWRAPLMLRSAVNPGAPGGVVFDSAARVLGDGRALELVDNAHDERKLWNPPTEFTVIPNDGISFPETKRHILSLMSINNWDHVGEANWRTGSSFLAFSDDGNAFQRVPGLVWPNDEANTDPFQMWTMQRDGDYVYIFSVRAGRQTGPMMLRRVRWDHMFDMNMYEGWGWDGKAWAWGRPCTPILEGRFGEPSVRKLSDGTWAMAYLNVATLSIVTRTATAPDAPWSAEKVQVTAQDEPGLYGGFIHPWSKSGTDNLHMMVSKMLFDAAGKNVAYHVSQYVGSL